MRCNHTCKLRSIFLVAQAGPHRLKFGSIYSPIPKNKKIPIAGFFECVGSLLLNRNRRLATRGEVFLRAPASPSVVDEQGAAMSMAEASSNSNGLLADDADRVPAEYRIRCLDFSHCGHFQRIRSCIDQSFRWRRVGPLTSHDCFNEHANAVETGSLVFDEISACINVTGLNGSVRKNGT